MAAFDGDARATEEADALVLRTLVPAVLRKMGPPTTENMMFGVLLALLMALEIRNMTSRAETA